MPLPTHDALLRERFNARKAEAQSLISTIVAESGSQYAQLEAIAGELMELAAHFKEPLAFEVDAEQVALKQRVMELLGPIVAASAEQKG